MKITAAVVPRRAAPFEIDELDLTEPRSDELLVEVVASGLCATDLHGRDGYYPMPFPAVFGHEGAGVVRAIGSAVTKFKPGDRVVMAYPWCGECPNCRAQRQTYCLHAAVLKLAERARTARPCIPRMANRSIARSFSNPRSAISRSPTSGSR